MAKVVIAVAAVAAIVAVDAGTEVAVGTPDTTVGGRFGPI
jgi:hypothetical protein